MGELSGLANQMEILRGCVRRRRRRSYPQSPVLWCLLLCVAPDDIHYVLTSLPAPLDNMFGATGLLQISSRMPDLTVV